jgi:hypothetical protein
MPAKLTDGQLRAMYADLNFREVLRQVGTASPLKSVEVNEEAVAQADPGFHGPWVKPYRVDVYKEPPRDPEDGPPLEELFEAFFLYSRLAVFAVLIVLALIR